MTAPSANQGLSPWPMRLTLFRLAAGPVVAALLLYSNAIVFQQGAKAAANPALIALILFILAAASDGLDGYLARRLNAVTARGAALDHAADKALTASVLLGAAAISLPADLIFAGCILVARDFAISGLREGGALAQPGVGRLGKWKAAAAMVGLGATIAVQYWALINGPAEWMAALAMIARWALWAAALLAVASAVTYLGAQKSAH